MMRVVLNSLLVVMLVASPALCCCTIVPAAAPKSGEGKCCCCRPDSQKPSAPNPSPQKSCSCKQKQPYVLVAADSTSIYSNLVVGLAPAVDHWLHPDADDDLLWSGADFTHIHCFCLTAQERLRALPILRL